MAFNQNWNGKPKDVMPDQTYRSDPNKGQRELAIAALSKNSIEFRFASLKVSSKGINVEAAMDVHS